MEENNDTEN